MQDKDGQDKKRPVGGRIDTSSSKEVLVEVDAFAGRDREVPVLLNRLTDPRKAKAVECAIEDGDAHDSVHRDAEASLERRQPQVEQPKRDLREHGRTVEKNRSGNVANLGVISIIRRSVHKLCFTFMSV